MASSIDVLAAELITVGAAALTDPPARAFVSHGEPVWECALLAAFLRRMRAKLTGSGDQCMLVWVADFQVVLLRDVCGNLPDPDTGAAPTADAMNTENLVWAAEGETLARAYSRSWALGTWPEGMACSTVSFGALEPFNPQGGLAGWRLTLSIELT